MLSNIPSKLPLPAFTAAFSVQCDGGAMGSPDLGFNEAGAIQQPVHRAILTCSGTPSHVGAPNQPQNYLQARSMVKVTGDLWLAHGSPPGPQAGVTITPDVLGNTMGV
jgi:hypothetical protein